MHPTAEELLAFAQGRLPEREVERLEEHVLSCETCVKALADAPGDTLVNMLHGATIAGETTGDAPAVAPGGSRPGEIPPELADHPRYRAVRHLGTGGMGSVYLARHRLMDRDVAIKIIRPELLRYPGAEDRFQREVRAAARLAHANIVAAYDADHVGGLCFLVMEYVPGRTIAEVVAAHGPLPVAHACHFARQAALGLSHAHEKGMVHRDIKPQNLLLTRANEVKILDFGLARLLREAPAPESGFLETGDVSHDLTRDGAILGTPDYISPEQVFDSRFADARSDLYSLGCTLYFMLAGRPPFDAHSPEEMAQAHLSREPEPLESIRTDVTPGLGDVVRRLMAKAPAERFTDSGEAAKALAPFARTSSRPARPAEAPKKPPAGPVSLDPLLIAPPRPGASLPRPAAPLGRRPFPVVWISAAGIGAVVFVLIAAVCVNWISGLSGGTGEARPEAGLPKRVDPGAVAEAGPGGAPPAERGAGGDLGSPAAGGPVRVAIVVPHLGFWWDDYDRLTVALTARGAEVSVVSSALTPARASNGREVQPEMALRDVTRQDFSGVVFIGVNVGSGRNEFVEDAELNRAVRDVSDELLADGRTVAAICGGPLVLGRAGLLDGKRATVYRELRGELAGMGVQVVDEDLVAEGGLATARDWNHAEVLADWIMNRAGR
jgi:serine/threonine protein kinase/putative intracellular protease/amidase